LAFVIKQLNEFDIINASKIEDIKWDWNPLWYIITNDETFLTSDRLELPWSHTFEAVDFISNNLLHHHMPCRSVLWEVMLMKVFFKLLFDKDLSCAYPFQGNNRDSINKFNKWIILSWLVQSYGYFETRWAPPIWWYRN
jgi:hypothetical protein